jgi:hypothetical protein
MRSGAASALLREPGSRNAFAYLTDVMETSEGRADVPARAQTTEKLERGGWVMALRHVGWALFGLLAGAHAGDAGGDAPARFYSGAEWVLDAEGHVLATSAVLLERVLDAHHERHVRHLLRATPGAELPRSERVDESVLAISFAPWTLDAGELTESVRGNMLMLRVVQKDSSGHVTRIHVVDATPIASDEYAARFAAQPPN